MWVNHSQRIQARIDIMQADLIGILSHAHYKKLIITGKVPDSVITLVPGNYFVKFSTWVLLINFQSSTINHLLSEGVNVYISHFH